MPRQTTTATAGPLLPGYRDFAMLARSESSEVYRAHQDGVDRPVAIKVLLLGDDEALARFQREVDITVQLGRQHPHIVTVLDVGTTAGGRPCIVMEYYDRGSVHDRLRAGGPLAAEEVLAAGIAVADALSFAHGHGVLHRDIKPQNILVLPTTYVLADFGIARRVDAGHTSSVEWFSFRHAAPQVLDGESPAVADDIWSVGSTLFTLLDGLPPFAQRGPDGAEEDTALAYMKRVRTGRPRALERADVPPGLVAIVERCLRHERTERYPDAAALHAALAGLGSQARSWAPKAVTGAPDAGGPAGAGATAAPDAGAPDAEATGPAGTGATAALVAERPGVVAVRPAALVPQAPPPVPAARPSPVDVAGPTAARPGGRSPHTMARLVASAVSAGGYEVGTPPPVAPLPPEPPPRRPGRVRRILLGIVASLAVGGLLGVIGMFVVGTFVVRSANRAGSAPHTAMSAPARPSAPADQVQTSAQPARPTSPNVNNPEIAPTITQLEPRGGAGVFLRWQDRSRGEATFIVVQVVGDRGDALRTLPPGSTQVAIDGLDPATAPYCFHVIALVGPERGVTPKRCAGSPG